METRGKVSVPTEKDQRDYQARKLEASLTRFVFGPTLSLAVHPATKKKKHLFEEKKDLSTCFPSGVHTDMHIDRMFFKIYFLSRSINCLQIVLL